MSAFDDDSFIGGHVALDFINTVNDQDKRRDQSCISRWSSFVNWAQASSIFNAEQMQVLRNDILNFQEGNLLVELQNIREIAYASLQHLVCENKTQNVAMLKLESRIKTAISHSSLVNKDVKFSWEVNTENPEWVADLLVLSIAGLLCDEGIAKLRQCKRCTWMFLNSGRGKGRQWCNMKTCGNRAKLASFRARNH